jgi:hypothetical protein
MIAADITAREFGMISANFKRGEFDITASSVHAG